MQKKWFYRLLFSYAPVFFFIVLILIMVFYYRWSVETKERIQTTNDAFAAHVMNVVDSSLQTIENFVIQQMLTDDLIKNYYFSQEPTPPFTAYKISQRLNDIKTLFPFSGDVYIYKQSSGEVITDNSMFKLNQFSDASFVKQAFLGAAGGQWTAPRLYSQFIGDKQQERVVSLAKRMPITSAIPNGAVVVNVKLGAISSMLKTMTTNAAESIDLEDEAGHSFFHPDEPSARSAAKPWGFSVAPSSYSGWKLAVEVPESERGNLASVFFAAWIMPMLGTILLGIALLTYITHRNYKPIEEIMVRIDRYALKRSLRMGKKPDHDEFQFISSALDNLVEESNQYERRHKEDSSFRRKYWFYELLEGNFSLTPEEWSTEAEQLELPERFDPSIVTIVEIDNFHDFRMRYSHRDQMLFKFVINGVLQEVAQQHRIPIWCEWREADQLCSILYLGEGRELQAVDAIAQQVRSWVEANMQFTVSVYVGTEAGDAEEIGQSYRDALQAGQFRTLHGYNNVYYARETQSYMQGDLYRHLQTVKSLVKSVRAADPKGSSEFEALFAGMKSEKLPREKVLDVIQYLFFALQKEMGDMPEELLSMWAPRFAENSTAAVLRHDLIGDMEEALRSFLSSLVEPLQQWQSSHDQHALIDRVKSYLLERFGDPDLSLNHVSDQFEIPSRVLSKLFKAETGERFIDFVIRIRMEQAKRLLTGTSEPVQAVGERVGYLQVISFIRTFKKCEDITPGEYRKLHQSARP